MSRRSLILIALVLICVACVLLVLRGMRNNDPVTAKTPASSLPPRSKTPEKFPLLMSPEPSASAAEKSARRNRGDTFISATWGGGKGQLGRSRPEEGNPEAPMSFAMDTTGGAVVLDQVNGRLVRYDASGKLVQETAVGMRAPQDLAISKNGSIAVMDRLADKTIAIYGPNGEVKGKFPVNGTGIDDPGSVTGVFVEGKDVYAEVEHGTLVKVGSTDGSPATDRTEIPGRPSRNGQLLLNAGIISAAEGRVYASATKRNPIDHLFTREFNLRSPVMYLLMLDSDLAGVIYLAVVRGEGADGTASSVALMCLDPRQGEPLGVVELPVNGGPEETFREMVALDDGGVMYAERSDTSSTYRYYSCP